jgi:S1-C subfamily serine protease
MVERGRRFLGVALIATVIGSALIWSPGPAAAQTVREVFEKVAPTVVVIRARGRDVTTGGQSRFAETGSGVLISSDGKVMTAAHVVHAMDEIAVQFLGGETVAARVVASEPAADLSLLQLERVPPGAKVAVMADSNTVHVGDPVIIVGAPYGLSYSLSAGYISARWAPNTVYKTMPLAEFFQTTATINTGKASGYIVKTVAKDSPGESIGLHGATQVARIRGQDVPLGGDIILTVEGISMSAANQPKIREVLSGLQSGASFKVVVLRKGQVLELTGRAP